ncbi:MAG: tetratricopeptide repeat protein [Verrucomicrobiota bacterium]
MPSPPPSVPPPAAPEEAFSATRLLQEDLLARLEARVAEAPGAVELQVERAHLLAEMGRPRDAAEAYHRALRIRAPRYPRTTRAYSIVPFTGRTLPIAAVLLVAPEWGNAPFRRYLDPQTFLTLQVVAEYHDPEFVLPTHQLLINGISDADACRASLQAAQALLARTGAACVNPPGAVLATGREDGARALAAVAGVRVPRIATLPRASLAGAEGPAALHARGFTFPLLLRAPGHHTGEYFLRVAAPKDLPAALAALPGDELLALEFLDARGADGLVRKYRVMAIDGQLYPAHAAVSRDWKVHLFSSTAPEFAEHREEDRRFLEEMERVLGEPAMATLRRIAQALKLDYAGIDFSLAPNGDVLVFEANATMHVAPPDADERWAYRRAPVQRITDAVRLLFFARAFPRAGAAAEAAPTQVLRAFTLRRLEEALVREPARIDLDLERARLLIEMERFDEAKDIYLGILTRDPTQFVALNNLGTLLRAMGYHKAALQVHRQVVGLIPDNVKARVNFANSLRECAELAEAREQYETVLRAEPGHAEAHRGLAYVLMYQGETEAAWHHRRQAAVKPPAVRPAPRGAPRVLVFASPCGGNSPITRILNRHGLQATYLVPDFYDAPGPLPPHDLVINAVGDADHCGTSLDALGSLLERTAQPVINRPELVRVTGRAGNAQRLDSLEDVVTAKIVPLPREALAGPGGPALLAEHGLAFPVLFRTPGFHEGSHFVRVDRPEDLAPTLAGLPGAQVLALEFLDARDDDGKMRKYRVMMIGGQLYPLHKAVSSRWMIHYASADMADSPAHREEDAAFLTDMPRVLGPRAMAALERIAGALGLDYAGADFSLGRAGEVLLFEANATMSIPMPDRDPKWDFRRGPVRRIQDAVRDMILARAAAGRASAPVDNGAR